MRQFCQNRCPSPYALTYENGPWIFEIKEGNSTQDDIVTLMRALHTLKGSARMLEFKNIESLSHNLETVFSALKEERITLNNKALRLLLAGWTSLKPALIK